MRNERAIGYACLEDRHLWVSLHLHENIAKRRLLERKVASFIATGIQFVEHLAKRLHADAAV